MLDTFPASPALSACDSLDDQDLEALLAGLGSLSQYATPPLKDCVTVEIREVLEDESEDGDEGDCFDYSRIALHFAEQNRNDPTAHFHHDTTLIEDILSRAQLPPELLAISFNILQLYRSHQLSNPTGDRRLFPADLLTVAALALSLSYTHDHPPQSSWWAREICRTRFSPSEIDHAIRHVLLTVDWALHRLSTPQAIERAMEVLFPVPSRPAAEVLAVLEPRFPAPTSPAVEIVVVQESVTWRASKPAPAPLKIAIGTSLCATWAEGQLTPADTPLGSPLDVPRAYFLPLL
ncbi:hypothetical protein LTR91_002453 [Friedmanniomyces endolithicus]|uniref:Uncharacterized protein n=1 Tax=Friedmanniomyces endolithicus TaxID=329885 RepID=A0AAN6R0P3_9PEZI|nr:hypothetical protein LTR35_010780 [Friedmanniomyces endolithicus]KAK0292458.1 hypothetical protein LTS00_007935 [Friedmanniomyces endolithicus]KAK0321798.1 hypothetical protein LTR82_007284 [Friedmanniomyces endolithicus]KAK0919582.1 hypothetical protein LTR57_010579 [Friedmanniomyces endolithicus]KAK0998403.1 hypothetical protein LTR54_009541 [Friedmanniomyces endolithicus]